MLERNDLRFRTMTERQDVIEAGSFAPTLDFRVLGPLDVRVNGEPAALGVRKQRGVLALLVAAGGRPVSVDALLIATYGDDASPTAKSSLHTYVSNLRHVLGDVIVHQGDAYRLDLSQSTVDAADFEQACTRATVTSDPVQ